MPTQAIAGSVPALSGMQKGTRGANPVAQWILDHRNGAIGGAELQKRINNMGPDGWPEAFEGLRTSRIPVVRDTKHRGLVTLADAEREVLLASFGVSSVAKLRAFLAKQSKGKVDMSLRLTVLEILKAHGNIRDLSSLVQWARTAGGNGKVKREIREGFGSALSTILLRHKGEVSSAGALYAREHLAFAPQVAAAIGQVSTAKSAQLLIELVGRIPEADSLLLRELAALQETIREPVPDNVRSRLSGVLRSASGTNKINAIIACGKMVSDPALPTLIDLLRHQDPNISEHAYTALLAISKAQFRNDHERWLHWYELETTWFQDRYPELLHQALNGLPGLATRSLLEISKHPAHRESLARDIIPCFDRPDQELVVLACAVQGHLGSYHSIPSLKGLLDPTLSVPIRKAALDALKRITGENHGAERSAWDAAGW